MTDYLSARFVLACILALSFFCPARVRGGNVELAWNPSSDGRTAGYHLYYGLVSGVYTSSVDAQTNLTATVAGLTPGLTYYFTVTAYDTNGDESAFANEVANRLPMPPQITAQPLTQSAITGAPIALAVSAIGDPPLSFQWVNGSAPIPGAILPVLSWPQIGTANSGNYTVIVSNPWGSATSSVATLTVLVPPAILTQPQSQTVIATTAASFSSAASGTAPLTLQWYCGSAAIAGATNNVLAWASVAASNAGNYYLTVSNAAGAASSSAATLTVLPTNTIATAAGAYNGLFFQTNADGTADVTEATAGLLGNCVVASNGAYSARVYVGGMAYPFSGRFDVAGNASGTIPRSGAGLSNLAVVLHLDLIRGTRQVTGTVSSTTAGNAWTASLLGDLATNAFPQIVGDDLLISPGSSTNSPTNFGVAVGVVLNSVLTLSGVLGDAAAFSQTVPISKDGNVPLYANLYTNGGLLEGWLNLAGSAPTGNLTWIRPGGVLQPAGYPLGFDTQAQVGGVACAQGVGFLGASGPGTYPFASSSSATSGWIVFQDANGNQYYEATGSAFTVTATTSLTFWACAGNNNPTPSGVITVLEIPGNVPTLATVDIRGLAGLQTCGILNQSALISINASGCASLTSLACNYSALGIMLNVSNCGSLVSLSEMTSTASVAVQNAIIATLPAFTSGTHTLYWSAYAPANTAGDAVAAARGWTVNR